MRGSDKYSWSVYSRHGAWISGYWPPLCRGDGGKEGAGVLETQTWGTEQCGANQEGHPCIAGDLGGAVYKFSLHILAWTVNWYLFYYPEASYGLALDVGGLQCAVYAAAKVL